MSMLGVREGQQTEFEVFHQPVLKGFFGTRHRFPWDRPHFFYITGTKAVTGSQPHIEADPIKSEDNIPIHGSLFLQATTPATL